MSTIQILSTTQNDIGEDICTFEDVKTVKGFLDLISGEANFSNFNAKVQESTHVFICDFFELGQITSENSRMKIGEKIYSITLIDNPMELNHHMEIFLKFIGGV